MVTAVSTYPHVQSGGPDSPQLRPFEPAVNGTPLKTRVLRPAKGSSATVTEDIKTGTKTLCRMADTGLVELEATGCRYGDASMSIYSISPSDPLSARAEVQFRQEYGREGLELAIGGWTKVTADRTHFHFTARFDAWERDVKVFGRDYSSSILRDRV